MPHASGDGAREYARVARVVALSCASRLVCPASEVVPVAEHVVHRHHRCLMVNASELAHVAAPCEGAHHSRCRCRLRGRWSLPPFISTEARLVMRVALQVGGQR